MEKKNHNLIENIKFNAENVYSKLRLKWNQTKRKKLEYFETANITDVINQRRGRQQRLTHSKLQICKALSRKPKCIYSLCKHDASADLIFLGLDEKQPATAH